MRKYAHVVIIHCSDYADIARAFTREEDAEAFIEDCKKQESLYPNGKYYTYETKQIELDGTLWTDTKIMDDIEYVLKDILDDALAMLDDCKSRTDPSEAAALRIQMYASDLCEAVDTFYRNRGMK